MQIGAVNPVNFKSNEIMVLPTNKDYRYDNEFIDLNSDDYTVTEDEDTFEVSENKIDKKPDSENKPVEESRKFNVSGKDIENFAKTVDKTRGDVKISTILASGAFLAGVLVKGNKATEKISRIIVTVGESASKAAVGLIGKANKNFNTEAVKAVIANKANKLRDNAPNEKMLNGIKTFVDKIIPQKAAANGEVLNTAGDAVVKILDKMGIRNTAGLVRGCATGAIALGLTDKFADKVENIQDKAEIESAKRHLTGEGFNVAAELIDAVM